MKKFTKLIILFSILCMTASISLKAQTNWTQDQTLNGVKCYHKIEQCNGVNVVFLKFDNTTNGILYISWKEVFNTQLENNIEGWKGVKQMTLAPGVTEQSNCSDNRTPSCLLVPLDASPAYPAVISNFSFSNLSVTSTQ